MKTIYTLFICLIVASGYSQQTTTIYIIRHAEKAGNNKNSGLTAAGKERAKSWAAYFKDKDIKHFYFTDAQRTVDTGMPVMVTAGMGNTDNHVPGTTTQITSEIYDPATLSLKDIAAKSIGENILIVGHSNTIAGNINKLLRKNIYKDIPETQYDNLYIIKIKGDDISHEVKKI